MNMKKAFKPRDSTPNQLTIPSAFVGYESEKNDEDQSENGGFYPLNLSNNLSKSNENYKPITVVQTDNKTWKIP